MMLRPMRPKPLIPTLMAMADVLASRPVVLPGSSRDRIVVASAALYRNVSLYTGRLAGGQMRRYTRFL
jgi:hypothetical protein